MPRPDPLHSTSAADIRAELMRRERKVRTLVARRERLLAKAEQVETQIRELGGRKQWVRASNKTTLTEALRSVLVGKELSVQDAAEAVRQTGYKSNSPNFRNMVNCLLLRGHPFRRIRRGVYTAE